MTSNQPQPLASLKQKRSQYANQIRRDQRQQIIKERRKLLIQQLVSYKQITLKQTVPFGQLLERLDQKVNEAQTMQTISLMLTSPNNNCIFLISQIFQSGKYCYLIQNLSSRRFVKQTLSIFSIILSRPNLKYAQFLVSKGFLEILLELFSQRKQSVGMIANIIGNMCIESDDFCQIILQNNQHSIFMSAFSTLYDQFLRNQNKQNPQNSLQMILWLIEIIVYFERQYDEILFFCYDLLSKRIMLLKDVFSILYELSIKNAKRVEKCVHLIINQLLIQQTGQSQYLQDMLHLIFILTPGQFRYDLIFKITNIAQYKILQVAIRILDRLGESQYTKELSRMQSWWQRTLIKVDDKKSEFKLIISIMRKLKVNHPCVWRFVSEYLSDTYDKQAINQIFVYLKNTLSDVARSNQSGIILLLETLKRNKIPESLQKIAFKENYAYSSRAQQLLSFIQILTKQLKQKFQIQIQT